MSDSASAAARGEPRPVLAISDSPDDDPLGLLPCPVPVLYLPSALFSTAEYQGAPLVLLDDRSSANFALRHMPHRPGLIVITVDADDHTVYQRSVAHGTEAVLLAGDDPSWLHMRMHEATGCQYARWEDLLSGGPADPPPPTAR
ncbi:hypothetical protein [Streptomyces sp. V3I7]|uniref:hypothetical protein n=1 Tax=Streptomyces sp. V3I7 TaxID=3042278 RepID=UPI0027898119|nr:hypothetical protein [Streptomyces sp. V3I7]MDQ0994807.1 hypothetical protein [Streptomyces sp. V3I7]